MNRWVFAAIGTALAVFAVIWALPTGAQQPNYPPPQTSTPVPGPAKEAAAAVVVQPAHSDDGPGQGRPDILSRSCKDSRLPAHDGFQRAPRCVSTQMGEVSAAAKNPSVLITSAPSVVKPGQPFELQVSSRNLVRDRFLPAGKGGYYVERSALNGDGIQRGHIHTACSRIDPTVAPQPDARPDAFVATEDGRGGAGADTVTVKIPGLPQVALYRCATWAGDDSHRIPMDERADETPAFDTVRIEVRP